MSNIKVIEKTSKKPGKNIVILAGVHGNESFGCKILDKLIPQLKISTGKVTFIYANLKAIKQNKRYIDFNLNRCFLIPQPKKIIDSLEGKTAKEIMPYLNKADIMLDIHASTIKNSVPFIICQPHSFNFAKSLPFKIISYNWDKFEKGGTDFYMNLQKKVGICAECGYTKDSRNKKRGEKILINFLIKIGAIRGKLKEEKNQKIFKIRSLYKNKKKSFKKEKNFKNFEEIKKKTLIGKEGNKKIYVNKGNYLLFVHDRTKLNEECFLTAKLKK